MKFISGAWCTTQCLSLLPGVKTVPETTEKLSHVQWSDHKSGRIEEKLIDKGVTEDDLINKVDLVGRIEMLENGQAYQMVQI